MSTASSSSYLVSIIGRDQAGVISGVTAYLFEIGANLADSAFAVLGEAFEFSCVATFDAEMHTEELRSGLAGLEMLTDARINVSRFDYDLDRAETGEITHTVEISGGDRPGLVARVSEVMLDYDTNIVRMSSRRVMAAGGDVDYRTRFAVNVPMDKAVALENALVNVAGSLRLKCTVEAI